VEKHTQEKSSIDLLTDIILIFDFGGLHELDGIIGRGGTIHM